MIKPGDLWCDTWETDDESLLQLALTNNDNEICALYMWTSGHLEMYTSTTADFAEGCQILVET
jgi:hypothetical protein